MNWTPDKPIDNSGAMMLPGATIMVQTNYLDRYAFWTFAGEYPKYEKDVAIWRVKSLKLKP